MKKIFVCSPYRGNVKENIKKAKQYSRDIALNGDIPITPHIYFTQFLDDNNPKEVKLGMKMAKELLKMCDDIKIFGIPTKGMEEEIKLWKKI